MPRIQVRIYRTKDGKVPLLTWLDQLPPVVHQKCHVRISRLAELGYELIQNRKEAAYLRNKIFELRVRRGHVNYRILYFFHGNEAAVLSHGLTKEDEVSSKDIDFAIRSKNNFARDPDGHSAALGEE